MKQWIRVAGRGLLACGAALVQAGAGAAPVPEAASGVDGVETAAAGQGYVAGGLEMDFKDSSPGLRASLIAASAMSVQIRRRGDPDAKDITFATSTKRQPGMTRNTSSELHLLFVHVLPAGDYDVKKVGFATQGGHIALDVVAGTRGFTVLPGRISYLGVWAWTAVGGKNLFGTERAATAGIEEHDGIAEDSVQLYHARPDLRGLPIHDMMTGALLPAPGLEAEAEGRPVSDALPFRDVAALKVAGNIAPAVFGKLEAFHPFVAPASGATLRRIVLHRSVTRDGKAIGGNTRVLDMLPDAPGYVYDVMGTVSGPARILQYRGVIPVRSRTTTHRDELIGLHLNTEVSSSGRLNDVHLPDFDAALATGASWSYEYETDASTRSTNALSKKNQSNFAIVKEECRNQQREPASTLSPRLAGTMLTITCVALDRSRDDLAMAYLEDYGVFVPLRRAMTMAADGRQVISEFKVLRVELVGDAAPTEAAAAAASSVGDDPEAR